MGVRTQMTEEQRQERRKERLALLDQAVDNLKSSAAWEGWLKVRRSFHSYSWRNQLMIQIQRPDATAVNGFRKWLELNRQVKKGAKAVWILAPAPFKTGKLLDDGSPERKMWFKPVSVFTYEDTEQLEGAPEIPINPPLFELTTDTMKDSLELLGHAATHEMGVTEVRFEPVQGRALGYYQPGQSTIVIEEDLAVDQQFKTLLHELAHHLVHVELGDKDWSYAEEEVVVESTAYAVAATLGLETSAYSAGYVATWRDNGPEPKDLVEAVDTLATRIETILADGHAAN